MRLRPNLLAATSISVADKFLIWQNDVSKYASVSVMDDYFATGSGNGGDLLSTNNLSDLANTTTARTNLGAAPLASPTFTGTPAAPTASVDTNTTQLATTAYVIAQASASGDGTPAADGTAARGSSTHYARADHVHPTDNTRVPVTNTLFDEADGATITFTYSNGSRQKVTLGGNRTITGLTTMADGQRMELWLFQDGTGSRTVTWTQTIRWSGGSAPTLTTTASKLDVIVIHKVGSEYFGAVAIAGA